ncbi:hypothetical protein LSUE1_G004974 [Lachnellula suecica]|uniref:Uncharacterized protein n=1 Tax=Lachnellula suecica TaxID=602035 RepID=A0A8T9C7W1_9HELO|nr:hypothetical protein LSUE1_G004974 [Lachnellula suecica]
MARHTNAPAMLAYRGDDNKTIVYAPAPTNLQTSDTPYDSDAEPLIAPQASELDQEALMNFTATGRPIPGFQFNSLQNMAGDMFSLPQLLPKQYTDDSIIPAIVTKVIPSEKPKDKEDGKGRRKSFIKMLKGEGKSKKEGEDGLVKVVYMPRREYQKHFARDLKGEYIGSEPYKRWSEVELEETFAKYKPEPEKKTGYRPAS